MGDFKVEVGEFKGNKTISLNKEEKRVISFGVGKAKAILACIDDIKKFVAENDKSVQVSVKDEE
jgi:hypothetical protein